MDKPQLATNLLMDDFFMGEIEAIKKSCIEQFSNSRDDDYDVREDAYRRLKAVDSILSHFQAIAAGKQIEQKRWKIL